MSVYTFFLQSKCIGQLSNNLTNFTGDLSPPTSNEYQITLSNKVMMDEKKSPNVLFFAEI